MRVIIILILQFAMFSIISAQEIAEIEGDLRIEGKIEMVRTDTSVFVGIENGLNSTGKDNIFIGGLAGRGNTGGNRNVLAGTLAGSLNGEGEMNVFLGNRAGENTVNSDASVMIGAYSGDLSIGSNREVVFIGFLSGRTNEGDFNSFIGARSGENNTTGMSNTFVGHGTGFENGIGSSNTLIGRYAGLTNREGNGNTFVGFETGQLTTVGSNTMVGTRAGTNNRTGMYNTFLGTSSGFQNTTASSNTAVGHSSLFENSEGENNTGLGYLSGSKTTNGGENVFIGSEAGLWNKEESYNTYVGRSAGRGKDTTAGSTSQNTYLGNQSGSEALGSSNVYIGSEAGRFQNSILSESNVFIGNSTGRNNVVYGANVFIGDHAYGAPEVKNSVALGADAYVDISNKIRLGNELIDVIEGEVAYSHMSDRRLKDNITDTDIGLSFIKALRPVTYYMKKGHDNKLFTGLIAQEVESTAVSMGYDFSAIVVPKKEDQFYSLSYSDFVVPLINSVKELSQENQNLKAQLEELSQEMADIKNLILINQSSEKAE